MLIYSGIITLDYNPATDVLDTSMPDVREFASSEVSFCLSLIVDNIRIYDIKNLLLDASKSVIEVEEEKYKAILMKFSADLMTTRLKRLARVGTLDTKREEVMARLSAGLNLPVAFRNFTSKTEAMYWLLSSEQT